MATRISLRDANQRFAKLVSDVESGREFVVTRRGEAVARIVPAVQRRVLTAEQEAARTRSTTRLAKGWPLGLGRIDRESFMTVERFSVDTNLLIYAADAKAGVKHEQAVALLHAAVAADCVLTVQALAEFFHAVTRRAGMPAKVAAALVEDWRIQFPIVGAEGAHLSAALAQVTRHHLAFWDALLLETARAAGCRVLLSEDFQHGRSYDGLVVLDPLRDPTSARMQRLLGT